MNTQEVDDNKQSDESLAWQPDIDLGNHWFAKLHLHLTHRSQGTSLSHIERVGPLSVQKAFYPEGPDCAHLYLLHPPAGIVSGDELDIQIHMGEQSQALITTPGANRFYRARTDSSIGKSQQIQRVSCYLHAKSVLEHLPQETIIYNGADALNQVDIHIDSSAVYLGWDVICLGLPAANDPFKHGQLTQLNRVFCDNHLLFHDRIHLSSKSPLLDHSIGLAGSPVFGTFILSAPTIISPEKAETLITQIRELLAHRDLQHAFSITQINGLILARYLGSRSDLCKQIFTQMWQICRPYYCVRAATSPRIWFT
ncbi:urease accessory protein UreD [Alteromonas sp. a30]|uniref:urease accessory protein UreD n=1 Tax=Alteromonas sp. a30 TaxID=2730917 RepID=UPI002281F68E|nr:urease accessory protein UreD [Alteromonas sp. a30]MCY7294937.1 urease accessory protein UreD [Alteromonas sp. a30]